LSATAKLWKLDRDSLDQLVFSLFVERKVLQWQCEYLRSDIAAVQGEINYQDRRNEALTTECLGLKDTQEHLIRGQEQLRREIGQLTLELTQLRSQPEQSAVVGDALALLKAAIVPKSQGGPYVRNAGGGGYRF